ncbi:trigger factor [Dissulfurirhabdus thermomarina]|uniref:Trigger factor n=1 Tax=Dissulfurirhabdus thermomarina TaxID=1765737 RepID=A0A6N9TLF6_DISTH|nr:trigger factor [Dissulfurirhabdus thermomarina]NDY42112.1 trigger factor [Dissulfurirhabdus thermomarina]NMX22866.1 trigger factor [Dissulfurirhabdus thermomarina]
MKVTFEDISPVEKRVSVEVPAEEVDAELDRAFRRLNRQVSIKGFRKGKAPRSVLERHYGAEIQDQVIERLVQRTLPKALDEAKLVLVLQPVLDGASEVRAHRPFTYSARLDLWPEFDVPEYKGIELEEPETEVTEEEMQEQLEALRTHYATVETVAEDRPVETGDLVILDYEGFVDGQPVEGLTEENAYLEVGSHHFNPDFEAGLVGMRRDAEKEIEVTYPEDAVNEKLAGKTVRYRVRLKEIKQRVLPELDDEFARGLGVGFETLEDLRERLRAQLAHDKQEAARSSLRRQLLDILCERVDFPVPGRLVEEKVTQMVDNVAGHLQERGLDLERAGLSENRLREKMRGDAERQVKAEMILDRIAEAENITLSREEVSGHVEGTAAELGMPPDQVASAVARHVLPKLRAKKTVDFLLEHAVIRRAGAAEAAAGG